ncbi:cell division protein FtsL [Roseovarius pelagicus]|uniref:Cell division protein FtsL n=1 Tax=Roseovarius pelagicus TaxID=2980108 RepID=A0ABY6DDG1_9RHOB|nr:MULTISPECIES: cell division protein FtsL [Rhodobacterales]UXX84192.1 cell division protein FtsL [Roseovarius pelagicus]
MRSLFYVLSAMAVIGLAYWAYHENYRTQDAHAQAEALEDQIAIARQRLRVLNAEWAYLNRPSRLRELADINFERLGLMPLQPYQFGRIDQVAFPPAELPLVFDKSIDVSDQEQIQ